MKVLLLSRNHTVQGMVSLAVEEMADISLDIIESIEDIDDGMYEWIFVDDTIPMYQEILALAGRTNTAHTVLLYHPESTPTNGFDMVLSKPFLPEEIRQTIEKNHKTESKQKDSTQEKNGFNKKKKEKTRLDTKVLNLEEIETIKALLEEDWLEIVHEEELADTVLSEKPNKTKKKKKKKKDRQKELIEAIKRMKPKKIRKLLEGADVTIMIKFPKEER